MTLRVFLTGATGFIGGHTLRALLDRGHAVTALVRAGTTPPASAPGMTIVFGAWIEPESWLHNVAEHDIVVNTVGIIRENKHATFAAVHTTAAIALFEQAARCGVSKIVQISAMGADEHAESSFHLTKRAADEHLHTIDVPSVVLRPSFVYGPGSQSMAMFARMARLPLTPVPGDGHFLVQPLHVQDLTRAIVLAVERTDIHDVTVDAGGASTLTFDALLDVLAQQAARRQARKVHIPWPVMRAVAAMTDTVGGRGPITHDELRMLRRGNHAGIAPFVQTFGFEPRPFTAAEYDDD